MIKRGALLVIFLSMVVIGLGYTSAFLPGGVPRVATYIFAVATATLMIAILVLGVARNKSSPGRLWLVFLFVFVVLGGGFVGALSQSSTSSDRLWLGLPSGAAIILYIVGLAPLLVLPLAYALTFDHTTLSDAELDELRRQLHELKREKPE